MALPFLNWLVDIMVSKLPFETPRRSELAQTPRYYRTYFEPASPRCLHPHTSQTLAGVTGRSPAPDGPRRPIMYRPAPRYRSPPSRPPPPPRPGGIPRRVATPLLWS